MILLKRYLIAASTLLLAVGVFTSCSDDGDDNKGGYLSCQELELKQLALAECTTPTCMQDIQSEMCGSASPEECSQHYATECSGESEGLLTCPQAFKLITEAGCMEGENASSIEGIMTCVLGNEEVKNELCGDADITECQEFYMGCMQPE